MFVGLLTLTFALWFEFADNQPKLDPPATIISPSSGSRVVGDEDFEVRGKTSKPKPGHHYYIAIRTGADPLFWPKQPRIATDANSVGREWSMKVRQGGTFDLVVLEIPPSGIDAVERFFRDGEREGSFPGRKLADFPGAQIVHEVKTIQSEP